MALRAFSKDEGTVLITGASGAIATATAEALIEGGGRIVLATRNPAHPRLRYLAGRGAEVVRYNPLVPTGLGNLPACRTLVHMVESRDETLSRGDFWDANVAATCHVLDWARRNSVARVVLRGSSAVAHRTNVPGQMVDEDESCQPASLYGRAKFAAERVAMQWAAKHRIPLLVARLAPVFGEGCPYAPLERAQRFVRTGVLREQPGEVCLHPVHLDDAVSGLVRMIQDTRNVMRVYFVSGERPMTERELFRRLAEAAGRESLLARVPAIPPPVGERLHEGFSNARLAKELGYRARGLTAERMLEALSFASRKSEREAQMAALNTSGIHTIFNRIREAVAGAA